jgi:prepilin peptidase CpaA
MDCSIRYFLVALLAISALSDVRTNKIPNIVTIPFALFAIVFFFYSNGLDGFLFSMAGLATGMGLLLIPYMMGGMGAGDVKLMGAVGSFLGAKATFAAFILTALSGGIYSIALMLIHRGTFKGFFKEKLLALSVMVTLKRYIPIQTEISGQKPRLKYAVAIAFGTIAYLIVNALGIKFLI